MRRSHSIVAAAALLAAGVLAISTPSWALTVDEVATILRSGIGEPVIVALMKSEGVVFRLDADEIVALKEAGASDGLLSEMIRTAESPSPGDSANAGRTGKTGDASSDDTPSGEEMALYSSDLDKAYGAPSSDLSAYYDPFGYHWYASPWSYPYYYPFSWIDAGFYYAGWWSSAWWYGGSYCNWYNDYYCQPYSCGWNYNNCYADYQTGGRHAWDRGPGDPAQTAYQDRSARTANRVDGRGTRAETNRQPGGRGSDSDALAVRTSARNGRSSAYDRGTNRGSRPGYNRPSTPNNTSQASRPGRTRVERSSAPARPNSGYTRPGAGQSRSGTGYSRSSGTPSRPASGYSRPSGGSSRPSGGYSHSFGGSRGSGGGGFSGGSFGGGRGSAGGGSRGR